MRRKLAWLPQETIVFNRARVCRRTQTKSRRGRNPRPRVVGARPRGAWREKSPADDIMDSCASGKTVGSSGPTSFRATDEVFFFTSLGGIAVGLHLPRNIALFRD